MPRVGNAQPALGESRESGRTRGQITTAERRGIDLNRDAQLVKDLRFDAPC